MYGWVGGGVWGGLGVGVGWLWSVFIGCGCWGVLLLWDVVGLLCRVGVFEEGWCCYGGCGLGWGCVVGCL